MPHHGNRLPQHVLKDMPAIVITITPRENDDTDIHMTSQSIWRRADSIKSEDQIRCGLIISDTLSAICSYPNS